MNIFLNEAEKEVLLDAYVTARAVLNCTKRSSMDEDVLEYDAILSICNGVEKYYATHGQDIDVLLAKRDKLKKKANKTK